RRGASIGVEGRTAVAEDLEQFRFWHPIRVRYRDVDRQDIVYFGVYLEYFSQGIYEYFAALGIPLSETEPSGEFDTVFRRVEIDYLGSARLDDTVRIGVRCVRIGNSSLEFATVAVRERDGAVLAQGRLVLVNHVRHAGRSKPIPEPIRRAVADFDAVAV